MFTDVICPKLRCDGARLAQLPVPGGSALALLDFEPQTPQLGLPSVGLWDLC